MKEVQNKWNTLKLNDDIWAKLIYFERNRRLAKAYVSAPVLTVDGSTHGLDGFRIGLSGIDNTYRDLDSISCLRSIGQGLKLKIDSQGNILIRKIGGGPNSAKSQCPVWVSEWPKSRAQANQKRPESSSAHELDQSDISYKLFDMRKFRLQLEKRRLSNDNPVSWRHCVSIVSFVRPNSADERNQRANNILEGPCWIMLINIIAIDMIKSSIGHDIELPMMKSNFSMDNRGSDVKMARMNGNADNSARASLISAPIRTSSSSSILFASNSSMALTDRVTLNGINSVNNLSLATHDRVKKLRTANSKFRIEPTNSNRRYQSSQQLSSANSSAIYTTFNSKFINSRMQQTDSSSTSDYNSVSRSISSGQSYHRPNSNSNSNFHNAHQPYQANLVIDRVQQKHKMEDDVMDSGRAILSTRPSFLPLNKSVIQSTSLSSFDLANQARRLDLASMQSSIKMNYDNLVENEYEFGSESKKNDKLVVIPKNNIKSNPYLFERSSLHKPGRREVNSSKSPLSRSAQKVSDRLADDLVGCCCEMANQAVKSSGPLKESKEEAVVKLYSQDQFRETANKENQQKVSRSSIASSSSSSGCVDNDYLMSQSSSSMSSSSASNERELFSQPNSSSGIVGSGCTSDEYEQEGDPINGDSRGAENECSIGDTTTQPSGQAESPRCRGNGKKTIEPNGFCCLTTTRVILEQNNQHTDGQCSSVDYDCQYCCDCFLPPPDANNCECVSNCELNILGQGSPTGINLTSSVTSPSVLAKYNKLPKVDNKNNHEVVGRANKGNKMLPVNRINDNPSDLGILRENEINKPVKDPKQTRGWLEKRKYSKILPKFMFSSSNSQRQASKRNDITQENTIDNAAHDKFRFTRSSQDLS